MDPEIQQKVLQFESFINDVLKADLTKLEEKLNQKSEDLETFVSLKNVISVFKGNEFDKSGFKTKVDIGNNFLMQAHIIDTNKIYLDVGLSHFVEFSLDEALIVINVRTKLLERQITNLRKEVGKTNAHIKLILICIRDLQGIK
ncbi:protein UXT isoform X1 [Prorops nasuta]|uniref:protein UXT isoform X1 n=1 Tax=Prorops nasuta TaxID=863751 RepID=UPI0034CDDB99